MSFPKIELHVHFDGTVRPRTLLQIAGRNDYPLPVDTPDDLRALYRFRDFDHFIEVWILVTNALRRAEDFRQVVVEYAREAAAHGAVYVEGIFSPIERVWRGVAWDPLRRRNTAAAAHDRRGPRLERPSVSTYSSARCSGAGFEPVP